MIGKLARGPAEAVGREALPRTPTGGKLDCLTLKAVSTRLP
jgi:hypothetical protein